MGYDIEKISKNKELCADLWTCYFGDDSYRNRCSTIINEHYKILSIQCGVFHHGSGILEINENGIISYNMPAFGNGEIIKDKKLLKLRKLLSPYEIEYNGDYKFIVNITINKKIEMHIPAPSNDEAEAHLKNLMNDIERYEDIDNCKFVKTSSETSNYDFYYK